MRGYEALLLAVAHEVDTIVEREGKKKLHVIVLGGADDGDGLR